MEDRLEREEASGDSTEKRDVLAQRFDMGYSMVLAVAAMR